MSMIIVTPLSALKGAIRRYQPSHMITLLSPEHMIETPDGVEPGAHLRIAVNDVSDPAAAEQPPAPAHVEAMLTFASAWGAEQPLLIHCWAGISRSMAAAFIVLNHRLGAGHEDTIAKAMRRRAPHAFPNMLLVRYADARLGRAGAMIRAVETMGRGLVVVEGECVELPLDLDTL
ncbi:MAG: hypothetical protein KGO02_10460 [Alphaproteobacteria bacterium]|nr:hypothetical protein [Alphaproteobacteria bacterium]